MRRIWLSSKPIDATASCKSLFASPRETNGLPRFKTFANANGFPSLFFCAIAQALTPPRHAKYFSPFVLLRYRAGILPAAPSALSA